MSNVRKESCIALYLAVATCAAIWLGGCGGQAGRDSGLVGRDSVPAIESRAGTPAPPAETPALPGTPAPPEHDAAGPIPIPSPEQVYAQLHGAKQASSLLTRDADDFVAGLSHRVTTMEPEAIFSPAWANGYSPFETIAWAIYRFDLNGQVGRILVHTQWANPPKDYSLLWLGMSNWQKDRWDWYSGAPHGEALPGTGAMERYKHPQTEEAYVAVVLLGQTSALLRKVQLDCASMRGDWWMYGREAGHAACSPFVGPGYPSVKWQVQLGAAYSSCPAVYDAAGTVYTGASSYPDPGATLIALRPDGLQVWMLQLPSNGIGGFSPAIDDDGTIYFAASQGPLYAIEPDGTQKWAFPGHGCVASAPAIGPDGAIYILGGEGTDPIPRYLHALDTGGSLLWEYDFGEEYATYAAVPAVASDGTVYIGCSDMKLYAFKPDGSIRWTYDTTAGNLTDPVIGEDGVVYFASNEPMLYAVNPDGTLAWSSPVDGWGTLALGSDGLIYIRSGNWVRSYAADGTLRWSYYIGGGGTLSVDGMGNVYATSSDSRLYAIDADGVLKWWFVAAAPLAATPVIAPDGSIYIMDQSGTFYAVGPRGQATEHAASGYVKDEHGAGLEGVTMTITGEEPAITDASGYWSKSGLTDGAYLVSPSLDGYTFSPPFDALSVSGGDVSVADFVGSPVAPPVWPMWGGNCAHTHCSPHSGPTAPTLRWSYCVSGEDMRSEPALGGDGAVYAQGRNQGLYALNPDGSLRWQYLTAMASEATPAIAPDGTICTNTTGDGNQVRAFTPGGVFKWTYSYGIVMGSPVLAPDGAIIQCVGNIGMVSLSPYGIQNWFSDLGTANYPAIAADGTICVAAQGGMGAPYPYKIVALNSDGSFKWASDGYLGIYQGPSPPILDNDGTLYLSNDIQCIALNPDGTKKWIYEVGCRSSLAAAGADGTVFFTRGKSGEPESNNLVALNPDGSLKWEYHPGDNRLTGPPTLDATGVAYVSIRGINAVRAVNPNGTLKWSFDAQAETGTIAIGADGTLYFGDAAGYVYALGPGAG